MTTRAQHLAPTPSRVRAALAGVIAVTLVATVAGCGVTRMGIPPVKTASPVPAASGAPRVEGTLKGFYEQDIQWAPCTQDQMVSEGTPAPNDLNKYECALIAAPLNWDELGGEQISLQIARRLSGNEAGSALFYNLGGPGGAAVKSLSYVATDLFGQSLVDNFDIVAMDPRGVGASTPVRCLTDEERDKYNSEESEPDDANMTPQQIVDEITTYTSDFGNGCLKHSGDLARYIDTVSVAKDFDMARAALGQDTLDYLGYSYGTFLGATYAGLFPDKVGRFVLDGALDPGLNVSEVSELQMRGFEASLTHWIEDCQTSNACPLTGTVDDGVAQMAAFLDRLGTAPLETSDPDRPLTQSLGLTAVIGMMYSTDSYSVLTQAMQQALGGNDGSMLLYLADFLNDRNSDGTYASNSTDAIVAVNSLDYEPVGTIDEWAAKADQLKAELPILGQFAGYPAAGLEVWPIERHASRAPIAATGAPPIVVIGTTNDPATPYVMAQNMAAAFDKSVLVTWDGWAHTAYARTGSSCVAGAVETFLLEGTLPADGLMCSD